jgi:hypothetical protein
MDVNVNIHFFSIDNNLLFFKKIIKLSTNDKLVKFEQLIT